VVGIYDANTVNGQRCRPSPRWTGPFWPQSCSHRCEPSAGLPQIAGISELETGGRPASGTDAGEALAPRGGENRLVDLARIAWLVTVLACLIAVLILVLNGYDGYAVVTFAVAASAAINLK
jgi:hypothetical protein